MIYQARLRIKSMKVKPISPVVFGNIAKTIFDIMPEGEARQQIYKLIECKTLISDILPVDALAKEKIVSMINEAEENNEFAGAADTDSLREKKHIHRAWRYRPAPVIKEGFIETVRRRTMVDRESGKAAEKILFNDTEKWFDRDTLYSLYIAVQDEKIIPLLDLVLRVIEQTGFGTDNSTGAGQLEFIRENGRVLVRDQKMEEMFIRSSSDTCVNIASTILTEEVIKENVFVRYCVERYDSRNPRLTKPPYFYLPAGNLVIPRDSGPFIAEYRVREKTAFIYNCIFPVRAGKEGMSCDSPISRCI